MSNSYNKVFDIRWSDIDANRHVTSVTYSKLCIETRLALLREHGFSQDELAKMHIGPAIVHEELFYLREVKPDDKITVELQIKGITADKRFFKFGHSMLNGEKEMAVYNICTFCWIDLKERKLCVAPQKLLGILENLPKSHDFKILTKEDLPRFH